MKGVPASALPGYGAASEIGQGNELLDEVSAQFATAGVKANGSQKMLGAKQSGRSHSRMTRATAASVNISKSQGTRSMLNPKAGVTMSKSSIGKKTAGTAVGRLVKPHS